MNKIHRRTRCLLFLLTLVASIAGAADYVGVWKDVRPGQETMSFGFRKGGSGFLGLGAVTVPFRWVATQNGIQVKNELQSLDITFKFDPKNNTLVSDQPNWPASTYSKVSDQEPPEVENKLKKQVADLIKEKNAKFEKQFTRHKEQLFSSKQELLARLDQFALTKLADRFAVLTAAVTPSDSSWEFDVGVDGDSHYMLYVRVLEKNAGEPPPDWMYEPTKEAPPTNLSVQLALPDPIVEKLKNWLDQQKVKFRVVNCSAQTALGIIGYSRSISIRIEKDREAFLKTVRFLINDLFTFGQQPYKFRSATRN